MTIDPIALASVPAAVSALGNELLKGMATEAGKSAWTCVKSPSTIWQNSHLSSRCRYHALG
jgi:hypothetical protein